MRTIISLTGLAVTMVAGDLSSNCSYDDYAQLGDIGVTDVADCLTNVNVDNWALCLGDSSIGDACIQDLAEHIAENIPICGTPCLNTTSTACRICNGVVVIQQIANLMPNAPYGLCGSEYDRETIMNASWSDVVEAGNISDLLLTVSTLSDSCNYCLVWFSDNALSEGYCGDLCTDPGSPDCKNCLNVWWGAGIAYCGTNIQDGTCVDADFEALDTMNPAIVKTCMENAHDDIVHCLTDGANVNLTEECAVTLTSQFEAYYFAECTDHCVDDTSVDCYNCRGSHMVQEAFAFDSDNVNGSCGNEADRNLINRVYMVDVVACDETAGHYAGATCIASVANVSSNCSICLTSRTHHARAQCSPHCHDSSSVDCLECVNIGLLSAAAHCNAGGVSGSAGMVGFSLMSLAALLSIVLLA